MKAKTNELAGPALDWAVAQAEDVTVIPLPRGGVPLTYAKGEVTLLTYSTNWAQAGPIIERVITKLEDYGDCWGAEGPNAPEQYGPTPLVAAMRCYVASRLGEEVEVPEVFACR